MNKNANTGLITSAYQGTEVTVFVRGFPIKTITTKKKAWPEYLHAAWPEVSWSCCRCCRTGVLSPLGGHRVVNPPPTWLISWTGANNTPLWLLAVGEQAKSFLRAGEVP